MLFYETIVRRDEDRPFLEFFVILYKDRDVSLQPSVIKKATLVNFRSGVTRNYLRHFTEHLHFAAN